MDTLKKSDDRSQAVRGEAGEPGAQLLAASLLHEIRKPLGAIKAFADGCVRRIDAGSGDRAVLRETLVRIREETDRAKNLADRFVGLLAEQRLSAKPSKIADILRDAVALLPTRTRHGPVEVSLKLPSNLPRLEIDRVLMRHAILNLLSNSLEAMDGAPEPAPARLTLSTRSVPGAAIELAIEDSGPGCEPSDLDRIFEPGFTTKVGHSGLGLWLTSLIIEAHGGHIRAVVASDRSLSMVLTLPVMHRADRRR